MRTSLKMQTKLFTAYSIVLLVITASISIPLYFYMRNNVEQNVLSTYSNTVNTTLQRFDDISDQFLTITNHLYMSTDSNGQTIMDYLKNFIYYSDTTSTYEKLQSSNAVQKFTNYIAAVNPNVYAIHILTSHNVQFSSYPTRASVLPDAFLSQIWSSKGSTLYYYKDHILSLVRLLSPYELTHDTYLRVDYNESVVVPFDKLLSYKGAHLRLTHLGQVVFDSNPSADLSDRDYLIEKSSSKTGLSLSLYLPMSTAFGPINLFRNVTIGTIFLIIAFSLSVFYFLSRMLTAPLKNLKSAIDAFDFDSNNTSIHNSLKLSEIESLNRAFCRMEERLRNSLEETVYFRTLQLQSHFETLQAQINPHFLFNMLAVIQTTAGRGKHHDVVKLTEHLSDFLSYSIDTGQAVSTVQAEADFVGKYLQLMKSRYMHRLDYQIDIDPELEETLIPKLTLQPFVENAIHHGYNGGAKTMNIQIRGEMCGEFWRIKIEDDGCGFDPQMLDNMNEEIRRYLVSLQNRGEAQKLKIGGMGLINTIARLQVAFKEQVTCQLFNGSKGGAVVLLTCSTSIRGAGNETKNFTSR